MTRRTEHSDDLVPRPASLDRRLLRIGIAATQLLCVIGCITNLALGIAPLATAVMVCAVLLATSLAVAERRGVSTHLLATVFATGMVVCAAVAWFSAGGIRSSMGVVVVILASAGTLVLPQRAGRFFLLALLGTVLALVAVELTHPREVAPLLAGFAGALDSLAATAAGILAVGFGTSAVRAAYDRERAELHAQKRLVDATGEQLSVALAAAERSDRAKSLFLAHMSHELRTPLAGVVGRAELLGLCPLDDAASAHVQALERASKHLQRLVDDVLDLGRIERDEFTAREDALCLDDVLQDAARDAHEPQGPAITIVVDPALSGTVRVDGVRLRQVVTNLLVNAVRHADATEVAVHVRPHSPGHLALRVEDNGRGIAADQVPLLFTPFERDSRSMARGGLGLGLHLVRRFVLALGGTFEVDSALGRGTRFDITLPCTVPHERVAGATASVAAVATVAVGPLVGPPLRVLSAEDDPVVSSVLKAMLLALGVPAVMVKDGASAIERARTEPFDVVFLDMNMPGVSGPDAARAICEDATRNGTRQPRLVALTASAYATDVEACRAAGMEAYLSKPVTIDELRRVLGATPASAS